MAPGRVWVPLRRDRATDSVASCRGAARCCPGGQPLLEPGILRPQIVEPVVCEGQLLSQRALATANPTIPPMMAKMITRPTIEPAVDVFWHVTTAMSREEAIWGW